MLNVGDKAPEFSLKNEKDEMVTLGTYKGKKQVLYFYPKDDTPGCTREAIAFTEFKEQFDKKNTVVLGVSKDSIGSHQKFCEKYKLGISLLSDENKEMLSLNDHGNPLTLCMFQNSIGNFFGQLFLNL